ncbi:MAG: hypothetical protein M3N93_07515 [Acidobacteriota bacterium]|nr:hypothetical protein [Acidobacteriota bacterium]
MPSPVQFNHLITVIGTGPDRLWLDTTPEVAPFGALIPGIRGHEALLIPVAGKPAILTTPANLPFASSQRIESKSELSPEGTLKGHFDFTLRGDAELNFRSAFHGSSPTQWQQIAQRISLALGFAGKVSNVEIENLESTAKPFHYSYDYVRENYSDWANHRITPPMPPFGLPGTEDDKPPIEPIEVSDIGEISYLSTVHLPAGYSVEVPSPARNETSFSTFRSSYSVSDSVLTAERHLTMNISTVPAASWPEYQRLRKAVENDGNRFIVLAAVKGGAPVAVTENNAQAEQLIEEAGEALRQRDMNAARNALMQVERLNPKQLNLWTMYGYLYFGTNQIQKGMDSLDKEIKLHPNNLAAWRMLAEGNLNRGQKAAAQDALRQILTIAPGDVEATIQLTEILNEKKQYPEMLEPLRAALAVDPENERLQGKWIEALMRSGKQTEAVEAAKKLGAGSDDALTLNDVAYILADTNSELPLAQQLAEKAVAKLENDAKQIKLASLSDQDLRTMNSLNAYWDTLGWAYFRNGDSAKAEKYLEAAWKLGQTAAVAEHLADVYEKEGKRDQTVETLRLAVASDNRNRHALDRLTALGAPQEALVRGKPFVAYSEKLGRLRTTDVPSLPVQHGSAEFFLLFSRENAVEDTLFISGDVTLRDAGKNLSKTRFDVAFPDEGPERIVRRGILSCSKYTSPSCRMTLLLPSTTEK